MMTAPTVSDPEGKMVTVVGVSPVNPTVVVRNDSPEVGSGVWMRTVVGSPTAPGASVVVATPVPKNPVVRVTMEAGAGGAALEVGTRTTRVVGSPAEDGVRVRVDVAEPAKPLVKTTAVLGSTAGEEAAEAGGVWITTTLPGLPPEGGNVTVVGTEPVPTTVVRMKSLGTWTCG